MPVNIKSATSSRAGADSVLGREPFSSVTSILSSILRIAFNHWVCAVPVILFVATLSIRQFDYYPPSTDELYSMYNAGLLVDGPFSPAEVVGSLQRNSPNHMPGYFLLLSAWGNLVSNDVAIARVLGVFGGLLSLSISYRLARDFVAPAAGLIAVLLVAGNTQYSFFYSHIRMYSLIVFIAGCTLWLYLRIIAMAKHQRPRHVVAFAILCVAALSLQALSAFVQLFSICVFHLFCVQKSRRWWTVPSAIVLATVSVLPFLVVVFSGGVDRFEQRLATIVFVTGSEFTIGYMDTMLNNLPLLMLVLLVGLGLSHRRRAPYLKRWFLIWFAGFAALTAIFEVYGKFGFEHMRYGLSNILPFVMLMSAGIYALSFRRVWRLGILLIYLIAAVSFQQSEDWKRYHSIGRTNSFARIPLHAVSRLAIQANISPLVLTFSTPEYPSWGHRDIFDIYTDQFYFFSRHNIRVKAFEGVPSANHFDAVVTPAVWIVYHAGVEPRVLESSREYVRQRHYQSCGTDQLGINGVVERFRWRGLDCDSPPRPQASSRTRVIEYQFYGARLDMTDAKLFVVELWRGVADMPYKRFNVSYQLISSIGENVAQLDLPFGSRPQEITSQYFIDISEVSAGTYNLVAIVYDSESGERLSWAVNPDAPPEILTLAALVIPTSDIDP